VRSAVQSTLTGDGRALIPRLPPIFGRANKQLFHGFTAAEINLMTSMLTRMLHNLAAPAGQRS
jgi:DNA-binding MarR family transcriptional regulator